MIQRKYSYDFIAAIPFYFKCFYTILKGHMSFFLKYNTTLSIPISHEFSAGYPKILLSDVVKRKLPLVEVGGIELYCFYRSL